MFGRLPEALRAEGRLPEVEGRLRKVGIFELTEGICLDMGGPPKIGGFSPKMDGENDLGGKPHFRKQPYFFSRRLFERGFFGLKISMSKQESVRMFTSWLCCPLELVE